MRIGITNTISGSKGSATVTPPINTVAPAITGTAIFKLFGNYLTASTGTWTNPEANTYTYQWLRNDINISSATTSTYRLAEADYGTVIKCRVTNTNSGGGTSATSAGTSTVTFITESETAFTNQATAGAITTEEKHIMNTFIEPMVVAGYWGSVILDVQANSMFTNQVNALKHWINSTTGALVNGASPATYNSLTGITTTANSSINTNLNPSTLKAGGAMSVNDSLWRIRVIENLGSASMGIIGTTSTGQMAITVNGSTGAMTSKLHTNTTTSFTDAINAVGNQKDFSVYRVAAGTTRTGVKSQQLNSGAVASVGVPVGRTVYIGARNNNGTIDAFNPSRYGPLLAIQPAGADLQYIQAHFEYMLMRAGVISKKLYPYDLTPKEYTATECMILNSDLDQSNALFARRIVGSPTAPLDSAIPNTYTFWRDPFTDPISIEQLQYGVNSSYDAGVNGYNGGLRAAYEIQRRISAVANAKLYVGHYSKEGTSLDPAVTTDWYPDLSMQLFHDAHVRLLSAAIPLITETIKTYVWHPQQGEANAAAATAANYQTWWYYYLNKKLLVLDSLGMNFTTTKFHIVTPVIPITLNIATSPKRDSIRAAIGGGTVDDGGGPIAYTVINIAEFESLYPTHAGKVRSITVYDNDDLVRTDLTHAQSDAYLLQGHRVGPFIAAL